MATFEATVLAKLPVNFWRLDESSGPVAVDTAGGQDATYDVSAVLGRPSPVLTDPSSTAMGAGGAKVTESAPSSNWSYGGFLYANSAHDIFLLCRSGQLGLGGGNFIVWDHGQHRIRGHVFADGVSIELTFSPAEEETWYGVLLTRNGTVVTMIVNDEVVDQSGSFASGAMDDGWVNGGQFISDGTWKLGCGGDTGNFLNGGDAVDELMVFDYPLTLTDWVEIYEAAVGATFLHGRSDANPTAVLRSEFEPDPVSYPFRHNWVEPITERTSFRTSTSSSVTGLEENVSERVVPRRELEFTQVLKSQVERRKLRALLWANQQRKWFVPVRQYAERLVEALSVDATSTAISTEYKDYEVGGWIGFRQLDSDGNITHWEEKVITQLSEESIEHEPLTYAYSPYLSFVYPVRRAYLQSSLAIKGHSDIVEEFTFTARLLPEDEQLLPNRITPFAPTIKYRDVEVFDPQLWQGNDWSEQREYEVERGVENVDFDSGVFSVESDTPSATETFSYRMTLQGLPLISQFLGWYYERVGALQPLWVTTLQSDFDLLSINIPERQITVRDTNYSDSYALAEPRRDLAFIYWDGSMEFRRVIAFEVSGVNEILRLDAPVPTTVNLRSISLLRYCRLDADQLELSWQTDNVVQLAWRFRELLDTPEGTGLSSLSPSHSQSVSLSPSSSNSPSGSVSLSPYPSSSISPSSSLSPSGSASRSPSPSSSTSASTSPSHSASPSA